MMEQGGYDFKSIIKQGIIPSVFVALIHIANFSTNNYQLKAVDYLSTLLQITSGSVKG